MSGNFAVYLVGYILMIVGVAYGMHAAGLAQQWIVAAVLILAGLGVTAALSRSKRGDVADARADRDRSTAARGGAPPAY